MSTVTVLTNNAAKLTSLTRACRHPVLSLSLVKARSSDYRNWSFLETELILSQYILKPEYIFLFIFYPSLLLLLLLVNSVKVTFQRVPSYLSLLQLILPVLVLYFCSSVCLCELRQINLLHTAVWIVFVFNPIC